MDSTETSKRHQNLWRILYSFEKYYNIKHSVDVVEPFVAEAEFHSHDEKYVLIRTAKIAEVDSHEFVFFCRNREFDR